MEEILSNGLNIIPNIKRTIKEIISYFWQPSMERRRDYYNNNQQSESRKPKKEIDKQEHLSLDNIMMLTIGKDGTYMVTMKGLKQTNCDERVLLRNGMKEITVIEQCLGDNTYLERKSILEYMPSDYIGIYNEALRTGNYECCLTMLRGIESHINIVSKERNEIIKTLKRGGK
jgi:hypothetical protein